MSDDAQAFIQPIRLTDEPHNPEPIPVYDQSDEGGVSPILFDDTHIWSFDYTLAAVLDIGLTMIHNHEYTYDLPDMMRARDIFRRYATKDHGGEWAQFEDTNSEAYADLMWALDWLRDNFTALWT